MPPSDRHALVMKSTVPVGTGAAIKRVFAEQGKEGFRYVSCPEFLKEGSALKDFLDPDRVVIGDDGDWAGDAVADLYRPLLSAEHGARAAASSCAPTSRAPRWSSSPPTRSSRRRSRSSTRSPTSARRPAPTCSRSPAAWASTTASARSSCSRASASAARCFPKDVTALKQLAGNSGYHFQLLNAVIEVNELQKRRVIGKLEKHLGSLVGKRIALLGLAFKPNTDDMREASSLVLAARLQAAGAHVVAYDPIAEDEARQLMQGVEFAERPARRRSAGPTRRCSSPSGTSSASSTSAEVAGRDAGTVVIDGRNALRPRRGARRRPDATRASGASVARVPPMQARDPRRGRGDAAAAADLDRPQAGRAAGRPAVHRLHARVARTPRRRRRRACPAASCRRCCARRSATAARYGVAADVRRGARAARHRRRAAVRAEELPAAWTSAS